MESIKSGFNPSLLMVPQEPQPSSLKLLCPFLDNRINWLLYVQFICGGTFYQLSAFHDFCQWICNHNICIYPSDFVRRLIGTVVQVIWITAIFTLGSPKGFTQGRDLYAESLVLMLCHLRVSERIAQRAAVRKPNLPHESCGASLPSLAV